MLLRSAAAARPARSLALAAVTSTVASVALALFHRRRQKRLLLCGLTKEAIVGMRRRLFCAAQSVSYANTEPLLAVRGRGARLIDEEGREFLDTRNNVGHVGHSHPDVVAAVGRQAALLNSNSRYLHPLRVRLAERLLATFPPELCKVFFVNSGSARAARPPARARARPPARAPAPARARARATPQDPCVRARARAPSAHRFVDAPAAARPPGRRTTSRSASRARTPACATWSSSIAPTTATRRRRLRSRRTSSSTRAGPAARRTSTRRAARTCERAAAPIRAARPAHAFRATTRARRSARPGTAAPTRAASTPPPSTRTTSPPRARARRAAASAPSS